MLKLKPILCSLVDVWRGGVGRQSPHSARISPCRFCSPEPCRGFVGAFCTTRRPKVCVLLFDASLAHRLDFGFTLSDCRSGKSQQSHSTGFSLATPSAIHRCARFDRGTRLGKRKSYLDRVVFTQVASFGLNLGGTSTSGLGNHARNILVSRCLIDRIEQLPKESPWSTLMVGHRGLRLRGGELGHRDRLRTEYSCRSDQPLSHREQPFRPPRQTNRRSQWGRHHRSWW
jgi:hypothetical protein